MNTDLSNTPDFRFLLDEFADADTERDYRLSRLSIEWRQVSFFAATVLPILLVFGINDIRLQGWGPEVYALTTIRCIWAATSVAIIFGSMRSRSPTKLDVLVVLYLLVAGTMEMYVVRSRPADFMGSYASAMIILFAMYYLFPISLRFRCIPAILFSIGSLAIFFIFKKPAFPASNLAIPVAFIFANIIGFFGSRQYGQTRRTQYLRMIEEQKAVDGLEKTLAKLKTLTGLIPVCAECKKIRDDEGYWNEIEEFVSSHSEVKFSLGFCVDCEQETENGDV